MHRSPHALDFSKARTKFLSGEDDPRAYLERCIATIAARDPEVHAFLTLGLENARRAADASAARYRTGKPLSAYIWGQRNTVRLRHPMSAALPFMSRFLDMAPVQLPGDSNMPRVQGVDFGASERMVVPPGHEEQGIIEMPTGQSGWPLSPFYRNSETAWERGLPTPLLPGAALYTLSFKPKR